MTFGGDYGFKDGTEIIILSAPPAESIILSARADESIILSAGGTESMMLSSCLQVQRP
jgi:hypothetical protein